MGAGTVLPSTQLRRRRQCWDLRWKWSDDHRDEPALRCSARLGPEGGETALCDILTKITDTGRKPGPGEFVMIIRHGNISRSPVWQSLTFLTPHSSLPEIDQTLLAGWCDGVLVLTVTTSLTLTRLHCSTELSFLSTCDVTRATRQLSPHQQPHWSSLLQGLQTTPCSHTLH